MTPEQHERWDAYGVKAEVPGVGFVPTEPTQGGTFAQMDDAEVLWL